MRHAAAEAAEWGSEYSSKPINMIRSIQVVNVRGLENKTFTFEDPGMHPNKVHLLIASNGFGKSSIAAAFDNLNSRRLSVKEKDCYRHDESHLPSLVLGVRDESGDVSLTADQSKNEIGKFFDTFVIRGPRKIKASQRPIQSGFKVAVAEFVIEPIELCKIPVKAEIPYKYRDAAKRLGGASKAAPNIADDLTKIPIIEAFFESKFGDKDIGQKLQKKYQQLIDTVTSLNGNSEQILQTIEQNLWCEVEATPDLKKLCDQFAHLESRAAKFLAAIQLIHAARDDLKETKKAKERLIYEKQFQRVKDLLNSCNPNPAWLNVDVKQTGNLLVISLPKPDTMSNGQRDFLFFVSQLLEFEFRANKGKTLLIIDEVFDYLDYANVVACQYFLKKFIEGHVKANAQVYPLVLTHLDPSVFNSFIFSKKLQKNHYLDKVREISRDVGLSKIIRLRGSDAELEAVFANYHAHHSLNDCDEKEMFERKGLKKNWGCSKTFKAYCGEQIECYLRSGTGEVDYLAVCLGLRVNIEKCACDQLTDEKKTQFTLVKRTIEKLDFAEANGASVPELHYLLAGLYNSALHANSASDDFLTPVISKLQNACIREMIREAIN